MYFVSICIYIFIIISYNIFILSAVIYIIGNILFTHLLVILYTLDIKKHEHFNQDIPEQLLELCLDSV